MILQPPFDVPTFDTRIIQHTFREFMHKCIVIDIQHFSCYLAYGLIDTELC